MSRATLLIIAGGATLAAIIMNDARPAALAVLALAYLPELKE